MRPYDGSEALGVDRWREPREERTAPVRYRCLDCDYKPGNGSTAYRHHVGQRPHHRVVLANGQLAKFSCCNGASK